MKKVLLTAAVLGLGALGYVLFGPEERASLYEDQVVSELPDKDVAKDYTGDVSGHWVWHAMDKSNSQMIGMGSFILKEESNKLSGDVYAFSEVDAHLGDDHELSNEIRYGVIQASLTGERVSGKKLKFDVNNQGRITKNEVLVQNKGHNLKGKSHVVTLINDKPVPSYYYWYAERASDAVKIDNPQEVIKKIK